MNNIVQRFGAIAILVTAAIYPQESFAGGFTGKDFAAWSQTSQDSYIETSITMAGVVLTRTHPSAARCVNDWYFKDKSWVRRNPQIRGSISENATYHPSGVIFAVLLRECGPLKR